MKKVRLLSGLVLAAMSIGSIAAVPFGPWGELAMVNMNSERVGYLSAQKLYELNKNNVAVGYVMAIHDFDTASNEPIKLYCVPASSTSGQAVDVVWKYLEQNPQRRHLSAAYIVRIALAESFPCPP